MPVDRLSTGPERPTFENPMYTVCHMIVALVSGLSNKRSKTLYRDGSACFVSVGLIICVTS